MYQIKYAKEFAKLAKKIPKKDINRLKKAINALVENPYPLGAKKLHGRHTGYHRIRIGDYRIVYSVSNEELIVLVIRVGHRSDIYDF